VGIEETLKTIQDRLDQLRGQLEGLSRAIWQDIDHEDPARLEAGVSFKKRYNERRASLEQEVNEMLTLLEHYPGLGPDPGVSVATDSMRAQGAAITQEPRSAAPSPEIEAASLTGDLDKKAPFGFVLGGQTFTSASAWPLFYEALLQELYSREPEKLSHLADDPGEVSFRGKPLFARVPDRLDDPLPIADAIFAEADLDPDVLLSVIKRLIGELGYPLDTFKILLKEKSRGTVETLSIAA
jgi:hypothetical protein